MSSLKRIAAVLLAIAMLSALSVNACAADDGQGPRETAPSPLHIALCDDGIYRETEPMPGGESNGQFTISSEDGAGVFQSSEDGAFFIRHEDGSYRADVLTIDPAHAADALKTSGLPAETQKDILSRAEARGSAFALSAITVFRPVIEVSPAVSGDLYGYKGQKYYEDIVLYRGTTMEKPLLPVSPKQADAAAAVQKTDAGKMQSSLIALLLAAVSPHMLPAAIGAALVVRAIQNSVSSDSLPGGTLRAKLGASHYEKHIYVYENGTRRLGSTTEKLVYRYVYYYNTSGAGFETVPLGDSGSQTVATSNYGAADKLACLRTGHIERLDPQIQVEVPYEGAVYAAAFPLN